MGAVVVGAVLSGCGGGDSSSSSGTSSGLPGSGPSRMSGAPGMMPPGARPGGSGYPGSMPMGGMGGATQVAAAAPSTAPPTSTVAPAHRVDPLAPFWKIPPPPPPPVTSIVRPIRLAAHGLGIKPPEEKPVVVEPVVGRVAGILTGNGIYALFEGPTGQTVVKPGDSVGDYRVTSINKDSITLKRTVGNTTFVQVVPLTDANPMLNLGGGGGQMGGMPMPGRGNMRGMPSAPGGPAGAPGMFPGAGPVGG